MIERDGWTVFRCAGCGLGVLDPRPDRVELSRLYEKEYFDSQYREGLRPGSPALKMGFQPIDMSTLGPRVPSGQ